MASLTTSKALGWLHFVLRAFVWLTVCCTVLVALTVRHAQVFCSQSFDCVETGALL